MPHEESVDEFIPPTRGKPRLAKAPRADDAPIEGVEVRTNLAGGFESGAREMKAITEEDLANLLTTVTTSTPAAESEKTDKASKDKPDKPGKGKKK